MKQPYTLAVRSVIIRPILMEWERRRRENAQYFRVLSENLGRKVTVGYLRELAEYRQFTVYKALSDAGKVKKIPYSPRTHRLASSTDSTSWGSITDALSALKSGAYNGINFVYTESDPFVGIDLDKCVQGNRTINYQEEQLIKRLNSYSEYSDRDGAHVIVKAKLPFSTRRHHNIEIFNSHHMLAVTLNHIAGTPITITERQAEMEELTQALLSPVPERPAPTVVWQAETAPALTTVEKQLVEHWKQESISFAAHYDGDRRLWLGRQRRFASKSECDFSLCLMLLSRTHDDVEAVKRLFRASGLADSKTDRPSGHDPKTGRAVTYLEMTIFNALKKRTNPR